MFWNNAAPKGHSLLNENHKENCKESSYELLAKDCSESYKIINVREHKEMKLECV